MESMDLTANKYFWNKIKLTHQITVKILNIIITPFFQAGLKISKPKYMAKVKVRGIVK